MKQDQIPAFKKYFASVDPELFSVMGPNLAFIPDATGDQGVVNMAGKQHFTKEEQENFKKIILRFEEQSSR